MGATLGQGRQGLGWVLGVLVATASPAGEECEKRGLKRVYKQERKGEPGGRGFLCSGSHRCVVSGWEERGYGPPLLSFLPSLSVEYVLPVRINKGRETETQRLITGTL